MRVACGAGSPRSTEPARQHRRAADWPRLLLAAGGEQLVERMPSFVVALVALDLSTQYRGLRSKVSAHWSAGSGGATSQHYGLVLVPMVTAASCELEWYLADALTLLLFHMLAQ